MGSKAMFKWSKQITPSLVEQLLRAERDLQKAILIFDSATAEYAKGFQHDHSTFSLMISKLVSANQFRSAEELLNRMKEEKCNITEDIFLSICRAYGRVHRPLDAVRIFHTMKDFQCKPTEKSYITVFAILVEENQLKIALRTVGQWILLFGFFVRMPNRGCTPDSYTYGTLINGLCRFGKIGEAKELFKEMETKGCLPSVVTYSSLIHGLCQSNDLDEALGLLEEMISKCIEPNVFTYSALMDGFCKGGRSSQAMELLEMMISKRQRPNMITYSTLIHGLCKEGKLREALEILDRMKLQGLKPDAGLIYNMVVQGLCTNGDPNRAFQLYLSMRSRGISINTGTFDSLVECFCKRGDLHKAARIVDEMVIDGCVPAEGTWNAVVGGFWDRRKVRESTELLQVELMSEFVEPER
uniref:Pentacotripeptide-repeat region of PRORP domain-containing protein n=1 Tax=Fagus sylvatica TaxID=28930 RepID=A0A2N9G090_FAGSY